MISKAINIDEAYKNTPHSVIPTWCQHCGKAVVNVVRTEKDFDHTCPRCKKQMKDFDDIEKDNILMFLSRLTDFLAK